MAQAGYAAYREGPQRVGFGCRHAPRRATAAVGGERTFGAAALGQPLTRNRRSGRRSQQGHPPSPKRGSFCFRSSNLTQPGFGLHARREGFRAVLEAG